jgi:hypothetical protein
MQAGGKLASQALGSQQLHHDVSCAQARWHTLDLAIDPARHQTISTELARSRFVGDATMRLAIPMVFTALSSALCAQEQTEPAFENQHWAGTRASSKYSSRGQSTLAAPQRAAITAGLNWLHSNQSSDGCWPAQDSPDTTVAITSLAMLAMLGDGNTLRVGRFKDSLKLGAAWLRAQQHESGAFANATGPHLLATIAIAECYMLSEFKLLRKSAIKAVQHASSRRCADRGWRANQHSEPSDPVLTLWGTTMLVTASDAFIETQPNPCRGVFEWLQGRRATAAPESGILGVDVPIARQGELAHDQRQANAFTLCWLAMDTGKSESSAARAAAADSMRAAALARARKLPRLWVKNAKHKLSMHEWFCSSYALAQDGDQETVAKIGAALASQQVLEGNDRGSWQPIGVWGEAGGRTWTTAMAVLTLEAPYRYTKIHGR